MNLRIRNKAAVQNGKKGKNKKKRCEKKKILFIN